MSGPGTIEALLLRPGLLTEEHLAGRGGQRLKPWVICVVCVLAFFASGAIVGRLRSAETTTRDTAADSTVRAAAVAWLSQYMDPIEAEAGAEDLDALNAQIAATLPRVMVALIPVFALVTWAAWRRGGLTYSAHLAFALHIHAAFFVSMTAARLGGLLNSTGVAVALGVGVLVYTTWYTAVAIKRVLGGTQAQMALRSTMAGVVYGLAFFATIVGVLVVAAATA